MVGHSKGAAQSLTVLNEWPTTAAAFVESFIGHTTCFFPNIDVFEDPNVDSDPDTEDGKWDLRAN